MARKFARCRHKDELGKTCLRACESIADDYCEDHIDAHGGPINNIIDVIDEADTPAQMRRAIKKIARLQAGGYIDTETAEQVRKNFELMLKTYAADRVRIDIKQEVKRMQPRNITPIGASPFALLDSKK